MPLEAMEQVDLVEMAAKVVVVADVKKAFYEAEAGRELCMEVPEEDKTEQDVEEDVVGELMMAMPGTRDAANLWQEEVARWAKQEELGFARSGWNPCISWSRKLGVKMLLHGDDFMMVCGRKAAGVMESKLKERSTVTVKVCVHGEGEEREVRILNRVVRAVGGGWEYEADQRHAEIIAADLGLGEAKGVGAPGEDEAKWEEEENDDELEVQEVKGNRSVGARANYLAADMGGYTVCGEGGVPRNG